MRLPSLSRLRFRGRIAAAFCFLLAIIAALGVVGIERIGVLSANTQEIATNYMQSAGYLARMHVNQLSMRLQLRRIVEDGQRGQDAGAPARSYEGRQRAFEEQQKLYEPTITTQEEAAIYAGFKEHWGRFLQAAAQVREAVAAKQFDAAAAVLNGPARTEGDAADAALTQDLDFNLAEGNQMAQDSREMATFGRTLIAGLIGLALLAAIGIGVWLVRGIASPVGALTGSMRRLANHDLKVEIPGTGRGDEVGEMADAVKVFRDNMIRGDELAAAQAAEHEARQARAAKLDLLIADFEHAASTLSGELGTAASQLQTTAQAMAASSSQAGAQAGIVASSAEEASAGVQTVAAATEELAASVGEIGRQVTQSVEIAARAVADARRTDDTVRALAEATQKIGDIVGLIQSIAGQTNLLALNATIEAARAGDAGKGFAVVASEVKNLATQTAKATEEIGTQIARVSSVTEDVVAAIASITRVIEEMSGIATAIAVAVEEQGAATGEIARNVQQTAENTQTVTSNIVSVSAASGEVSTAATDVLHAAGMLTRQSGTLGSTVRSFIEGVRAA